MKAQRIQNLKNNFRMFNYFTRFAIEIKQTALPLIFNSVRRNGSCSIKSSLSVITLIVIQDLHWLAR